jgi:hypothetical protein
VLGRVTRGRLRSPTHVTIRLVVGLLERRILVAATATIRRVNSFSRFRTSTRLPDPIAAAWTFGPPLSLDSLSLAVLVSH